MFKISSYPYSNLWKMHIFLFLLLFLYIMWLMSYYWHCPHRVYVMVRCPSICQVSLSVHPSMGPHSNYNVPEKWLIASLNHNMKPKNKTAMKWTKSKNRYAQKTMVPINNMTDLRFSALNSFSRNRLKCSRPAASLSSSRTLKLHRFTRRCGMSFLWHTITAAYLHRSNVSLLCDVLPMTHNKNLLITLFSMSYTHTHV